jgi:hypothetical protein
VVIGVIDFGVGFAHSRFRHDVSTTRIEGFWVQDAPHPASSASSRQRGLSYQPSQGLEVGYGREMRKAEIDGLLRDAAHSGGIDEDQPTAKRHRVWAVVGCARSRSAAPTAPMSWTWRAVTSWTRRSGHGGPSSASSCRRPLPQTPQARTSLPQRNQQREGSGGVGIPRESAPMRERPRRRPDQGGHVSGTVAAGAVHAHDAGH